MDIDKVKVVFITVYNSNGGEQYIPGDRVSLPADLAKKLYEQGVVTLAKQ